MNATARNSKFNAVALGFTAATTLALMGMVALTILTIIATDNSRTRTNCLRSAETVEQCPVASQWEVMLRKGVGL